MVMVRMPSSSATRQVVHGPILPRGRARRGRMGADLRVPGGAIVRTPICDRLDIEFPIFAFSHCRDVVAAVTNAGGFGVLGALAYEPERLEVELSWIDEHVHGRPYGVDFAMPAKYVGQGGGPEATPEHLAELIPDGHRAFVSAVLDDAGIPPVPADADRRGPQGGRPERRRRGPRPARGDALRTRA